MSKTGFRKFLLLARSEFGKTVPSYEEYSLIKSISSLIDRVNYYCNLMSLFKFQKKASMVGLSKKDKKALHIFRF